MLLVTTVAACGRVGFDAGSDAGADAVVTAVPALIASAGVPTGASLTITLPVPPIAHGDLVVIGTALLETATVVGVADDVGGHYVSTGARAVNGTSATELWYAVAEIDGASAVMVTLSQATNGAAWAADFSGVRTDAPLVTTSTLDDQPDANPVASSEVAATTHQLVFAMVATTSVVGVHAGNPFTLLDNVNGDDGAYYVAPAPGTYRAVLDVDTAGPSCASVAVFDPAPVN